MIGLKTINISQDILKLLCSIDEFKGFWCGLDDYTTGLHMLRDVAEHNEESVQIMQSLRDKTLTPEMISKLYAALTRLSGTYRQNSQTLTIMKRGVPAGFLETADPDDIDPFMRKLFDWLSQALEEETLHPLIIIAIFTAIFLQISPFEDKNIVVARFLVVLLMLRAGYSYTVYESLEPGFSDHGDKIFQALRDNQDSLESGCPDWQAWIVVFLKLMKGQAENLRTRLMNKEKDFSHLPTLSADILRLFEEHYRLQMKGIVKLTGGRRSTIKLRMGELVNQGYLRRHGQARSTWYSLVN